MNSGVLLVNLIRSVESFVVTHQSASARDSTWCQFMRALRLFGFEVVYRHCSCIICYRSRVAGLLQLVDFTLHMGLEKDLL